MTTIHTLLPEKGMLKMQIGSSSKKIRRSTPKVGSVSADEYACPMPMCVYNLCVYGFPPRFSIPCGLYLISSAVQGHSSSRSSNGSRAPQNQEPPRVRGLKTTLQQHTTAAPAAHQENFCPCPSLSRAWASSLARA